MLLIINVVLLKCIRSIKSFNCIIIAICRHLSLVVRIDYSTNNTSADVDPHLLICVMICHYGLEIKVQVKPELSTEQADNPALPIQIRFKIEICLYIDTFTSHLMYFFTSLCLNQQF